MRIGVVIPTWNEAEHIGDLVTRLRDTSSEALIIVADCGSTDSTANQACAAGARVVCDAAWNCRAAALAAGADRAMRVEPGLEALWFVHADCRPPEYWQVKIEEALADPEVVGGAFRQRFDLRGCTLVQKGLLEMVKGFNRQRYRLTGIYFGDQGLFVRPQTLHAIGGVPRQTLLEDSQMCRNLRQKGRLVLLKSRIEGSPRRFLRHGILRQMFYDSLILLAARLGIPSERVHGWYNREKG